MIKKDNGIIDAVWGLGFIFSSPFEWSN